MKISYFLPQQILTNTELSALYAGWSEEKIFKKTGIKYRHIAGDSETSLDLAEKAAVILFRENSIDPSLIDFVLFCTQSPDYKIPTSACILQNRLGVSKNSGALDVNLGCSGFVYGLSLAKGLIQSGAASNVLLLTGETYSKYIHPMDKSVRTIFGDGAAAVLVDASVAENTGFFSLGTDGGGYQKLIVKTGGAREKIDSTAKEIFDDSGNCRTKNNLYMDGVEIFNFTLEIVPPTVRDVLLKNNLSLPDIDLFVFHQANKFMLDSIRKVCMIPREKFYIDLEDTGNTVSSTIPIALCRAAQKGVLLPGMRVMIMGFGVGLSWGAAILKWV